VIKLTGIAHGQAFSNMSSNDHKFTLVKT
jgi:hypothetical protein